MFEEESGTRGPGSKSCLRRIAIAALAVGCLYAFYMAWVLHYPAVRGVVVDQATGQAIPGAEAYTTAQGYVFPQEKAVLDMNDGSHAVVASGGTFSFHGGVGMRWGLFWPLQYVNGAGLEVYAREYMPIEFSEVNRITPGSWRPTTCEETFRKEGDWEVFSSVYGTLKRRRLFLRGWTYRIEMIKAVSQEQWEKKCHETELLNSLYVPKEISDKWLFDDLTGYLARWPEGEKAGEYVVQLADLAIARKAEICSGGRLRVVPAETLEKAIAQLQTTIKLMDAVPHSALASNPVKQGNWSFDRESIFEGLSMMTQEYDRRREAYHGR